MHTHRPTRPAWRRLAIRIRDAAYRVATAVERLTKRGDELVPPAHLRMYYYRTFDRQAFERASQGARTELVDRGLQPEHRLLDIGSGIGNLALGLTGYLRGGYDGLEIHPEALAWCRDAITPRHPQFRFHHADVFSSAYNPSGRVAAAEYRFPFEDSRFDFVFLGSVFTHMLPDEVAQYVREIARVLAPGGTCIAGYYLLNGPSRSALDAGTSSLAFPVEHSAGRCRLQNAAVPEAAVALDEDFVRKIHTDAGLEIREIRPGRWPTGVPNHQDLVVAAKA